MDDIEEFYGDEKHQEVVTTKKPKKTKKRKQDGDATESPKEAEDDDLRKRARFYVKSPEQWRVVCKYPAKRLEEFVQEKDFEAKKEFHTNLLDGFHQIMASGIDKLARGEGHVREQLMADVSLKKAIAEESVEFVQYFSNKVKIAVLSFLDIANGKREQFAHEPQREDISIEEEVPSGGDQGRNEAQKAQEVFEADGPDLS